MSKSVEWSRRMAVASFTSKESGRSTEDRFDIGFAPPFKIMQRGLARPVRSGSGVQTCGFAFTDRGGRLSAPVGCSKQQAATSRGVLTESIAFIAIHSGLFCFRTDREQLECR